MNSQEGVGSRFRVYLPGVPASPERRLRDAIVAGASEMQSSAPESPAPKPLVLVVDDEPSVRALAQRLIERAGYRVIPASDGIEAVEVVAQQRDNISVVLLDLLMPRLGGDGALLAIRETMPDLPVLLSSGYRDTVLVDRLRLGHRVGFLAKPYAKDELLAAIGAMLKA